MSYTEADKIWMQYPIRFGVGTPVVNLHVDESSVKNCNLSKGFSTKRKPPLKRLLLRGGWLAACRDGDFQFHEAAEDLASGYRCWIPHHLVVVIGTALVLRDLEGEGVDVQVDTCLTVHVARDLFWDEHSHLPQNARKDVFRETSMGAVSDDIRRVDQDVSGVETGSHRVLQRLFIETITDGPSEIRSRYCQWHTDSEEGLVVTRNLVCFHFELSFNGLLR